MKQHFLLYSLKKAITCYTIIDPGGRIVKSKTDKVYREFVNESKAILIISCVLDNDIFLN